MTAVFTDLRVRVISALILAPIVLAAVYLGGLAYLLLLLLAGALALREWLKLTAQRELIWRLAGFAYVLLFIWSLLHLRAQPDIGMALIYYLLAVVWATDIGAYVCGRIFGGPKLSPRWSPKKTWSGLVGGAVLAALCGAAVAFAFAAESLLLKALLGACLAIIGQVGDVMESALKRDAGVKDSGQLIPGHGGILDRIDGLMLAALALAALDQFADHHGWWW